MGKPPRHISKVVEASKTRYTKMETGNQKSPYYHIQIMHGTKMTKYTGHWIQTGDRTETLTAD